MRLRTKIITTVGFIMFLSLLILSLYMMKLSLDVERGRRTEFEDHLKNTAPQMYQSLGQDQFTAYIEKCEFISHWRLLKGRQVTAESEGSVTDRIYKSIPLDEGDPQSTLYVVVQGAMGLAVGHATLRTAARLLGRLGGGELPVNLAEILCADIGLTLFRHLARAGHELEHAVLGHGTSFGQEMQGAHCYPRADGNKSQFS